MGVLWQKEPSDKRDPLVKTICPMLPLANGTLGQWDRLANRTYGQRDPLVKNPLAKRTGKKTLVKGSTPSIVMYKYLKNDDLNVGLG